MIDTFPTKKLNDFLGFDFGLKSIGVAYGQMVTKSAKPLGAIKNKDNTPNWHELSLMIKEWRPQAFVVGIPLDLDENALSVTKKAKQFGKMIEEKFNLPIYYADERMTTKEARARLFEESGFSGLKKADIDAISAQIILESWMNEYAKVI